MEKKNWIIAGICFALVAGCIGAFFILQNNDKQSEEQTLLDSIELEFNDIKTAEYGSDVSPESFIKKGDAEVTYTAIDTTQVGEQKITYTVTKDGVSKNFEYTINVVDTKAPTITLTKDKDTLALGKTFDMKSYIKKVSDVVDGDLLYRDAKEIKDGDTGYYTYQGEVNMKKAGTYKVTITAVDIHGNKSEKGLTITVSAESSKAPAETTKPDNGSTGGGSSNETYVPSNSNKVIVVNAGHQGKGNSGKEAVGPNSSIMKAKVSTGATGVSSKKPESQITLEIALKLRTVLQSRGYTVVMTRTSQGVDISNKERALIGNNKNAGAVISLHCDSTTNSSTRGAHTIAPKKGNPYNPEIYSASSKLATKVISSYCAETGIKSRGVSYRDDLTGLNWSKVPSIYIEMGFISNSTEDKLLTSSSFQDKCAKGIANGIDNYYK